MENSEKPLRLLRAREVAERLGCCVSQAKKMMARRSIPGTLVVPGARMLRVREDIFEAWLLEQAKGQHVA